MSDHPGTMYQGLQDELVRAVSVHVRAHFAHGFQGGQNLSCFGMYTYIPRCQETMYVRAGPAKKRTMFTKALEPPLSRGRT